MSDLRRAKEFCLSSPTETWRLRHSIVLVGKNSLCRHMQLVQSYESGLYTIASLIRPVRVARRFPYEELYPSFARRV